MAAMTVFVSIFVLFAGLAVGLQGPVASLITTRLGVLESIFIIHLGGAILSFIPLVILRGGKLGEWHTLPPYALFAGAVGLIVIGAISTAIPRVGPAATVMLLVVGQLIISLVIAQYGWLEVPLRAISPDRVLGIIVMLIGVWLVVR